MNSLDDWIEVDVLVLVLVLVVPVCWWVNVGMVVRSLLYDAVICWFFEDGEMNDWTGTSKAKVKASDGMYLSIISFLLFQTCVNNCFFQLSSIEVIVYK